jgi:hypothetical protein
MTKSMDGKAQGTPLRLLEPRRVGDWGLALRAEASGSHRVRARKGVAVAKGAGPLSLVTSASATVQSTRARSVFRFPAALRPVIILAPAWLMPELKS